MLGARAPLTVKIYQFSSRSLSRIDLHIVYTCIRRSVKFSIRARLAPLIRRNSIYALQTGKRQRKFSSPLRNSMEFSFSQLEEFNYSYFNFSHASSRSYFSERNVESLGVIDSIEFKKKFGKKKRKKKETFFISVTWNSGMKSSAGRFTKGREERGRSIGESRHVGRKRRRAWFFICSSPR